MNRQIFFYMVIVLLVQTGNVNANQQAQQSNWNDGTLLGDWHGIRTSLNKQGVEVVLTHKSDVMANVSGGLKRGATWMGHTEIKIDLDLERLLGWQDVDALIDYHSDLGGKLNRHYVGGFTGVDNIEVATNTAQFYQAWMQKSWVDEGLSVLAGLYAIDTEFYVTDSSSVFMQSPYGMANEVAQAGVNGPPIFPVGALAVRVKYAAPDHGFYAQAAVTDGVPGDPNNPHGTHIQLGHGDGVLTIVELGYIPKRQSEEGEGEANSSIEMNKTAIGFWRFTKPMDDLVETDLSGNPVHRHSQGVYFLVERTLLTEQPDVSQGLTVFMRCGIASKDVHQVDWSGSTGIHYHGLISGRDNDVIGLAATVNHASDKYQTINNSASIEVDYELTYLAQIRPWLSLQPTLQYFDHPGMDRSSKDATVVGFRTQINF